MRVALVFPGQGAQYQGMAAGLYRREQAFTAAMDEVFDAFGAAGEPLRRDWLAEHPAVGVDDVTRSTPLLFAVDYALARLVRSWGIRLDALLGHSIGEIAAATLAGVFELTQIAPMIAVRVAQLASGPAGAMLAVAADVADVAGYLSGDLVVGAVNAPRQIVLSGPAESVDQVAAQLRRDGLICRRVPALSPFHSPAMAPAAALGAPLFDDITMRRPSLPIFSAYLGRRMTPGDAADPAFWIGQPAAPVLYWPALQALLDEGDHLLIEVGPGDGLTTLARRHPAVAAGHSETVALLPHRRGTAGDDLTAVAAARQRLTADLDVIPAG